MSGGISAVINLGLLYVFTDWVGLWYLWSAIIAFSFAILVSFTLQKFWTFRDTTLNKIPGQFGSIALFNLGLNTLMMYLFVDGLELHYLLAQVFAGGLIAVWSFFAYSRFVFKLESAKSST
jgi:putative flippase GtrA